LQSQQGFAIEQKHHSRTKYSYDGAHALNDLIRQVDQEESSVMGSRLYLSKASGGLLPEMESADGGLRSRLLRKLLAEPEPCAKCGYHPCQCVKEPKQPCLRIALSLMLMCGLRRKEVAFAYFSDINFGEKTILVQGKAGVEFQSKKSHSALCTNS
jgi:hypothetical protein